MPTENNTKHVGNGVVYSEALKREVVEAVVRGKLSQEAARSKYGITGHSTVLKWVRKYQGTSMNKAKKRQGTTSGSDECAKLREEKRQLEDALLKATVRAHCLENILESVEAQYGTAFKKVYTPRL